jgi:hypothetical protein
MCMRMLWRSSVWEDTGWKLSRVGTGAYRVLIGAARSRDVGGWWDEEHLMECPLYSDPRTTLGLNARFDMTDEHKKEVHAILQGVAAYLCGNASDGDGMRVLA